jgi:hypothetical protein
MGDLYRLNYSGSHGESFAVVYMGRDRIVGMDLDGGRLQGAYVVEGGRLKGSMTLAGDTAGQTAGGQMMEAGQSADIEVDWPADFDDGSPLECTLLGDPLQISFEKIGDIP